MNDVYATLVTEVSKWPAKAELLDIFRDDGYVVTEGKYSVRLEDVGYFAFRELDGDRGTGCVTADHKSTEDLVTFPVRVSQTLATSGARHRFAVYSQKEELAAHWHHDWPKDW